MSIRRRVWRNAKGEQTRWIVDYTDGGGTRRHKQFPTRADATDFAATTHIELKAGTHVADAATTNLITAAWYWIATGQNSGLEATTIAQRVSHVELHIGPFIGTVKLNKVSVPMVREFQRRLSAAGRSPTLIRKVSTSLSGIMSEAVERGFLAHNPISRLKAKRAPAARRRLQAGLDIPLPSEVQRLLAVLPDMPYWRPCLMTAVFSGLRASELRGLRWQDLDLQNALLHVRQRADRYKQIGNPKSNAGNRTIPLPAPLVNVLREWQLVCPRGTMGLVFPNRRGGVLTHSSIVSSGLQPAMRRAKLFEPNGRSLLYPGLHSLRHFYASWCINRKADGGLELPPKTVQTRMGHSSIVMTLDVYGHLFPSADDGGQLDAGALRLIG